MSYDLEFARQQNVDLERFRTVRALSGTSEEFRHVFQLLALLLHCNHPKLPGYIKEAPAGICGFELSAYQQQYLTDNFPHIDFSQNIGFSDRSFNAINGVYVMGSISSICQTASSDLDIWVCHREDLNFFERNLLLQKSLALQSWAKQFEVDINLFLMDQEHFRHFGYADTLTTENCGSTQYMLLLDEFYRSVIRLAGKPLLWLHLWVDDEKDYETEVEYLVQNNIINLQDWVDFGGLGSLSANEYFGASLWQLYKGIDAPYKSAIKILLLEAYSWEYPNTNLIARDFKWHLLVEQTEDHHFDPYLAMLERVTAYLTHLKDFRRLDFARRCLYLKASEDLWYLRDKSWRFDLLEELVREWNWSEDIIDDLNNRPFWKIKRVKQTYNDVVQILMLSYRNLVNFARKYKVDAKIIPQDVNILSRKLYTAFEELPGKVTLLNPQISSDLSEQHLTFIEACSDRAVKKGWYIINQLPEYTGFSRERYIEYNPNLCKLVAWAYFNGLLTVNTQLHIFSPNVAHIKLSEFVTDLRLFFPRNTSPATNDELNHPCEIRNLVVAVNLVNDPTEKLLEVKSSIQQSDLFSFGPNEESLVGSIDLIYRNLWNEIRTLHFEGPNAILLAFKVLSNKIHRGAASPQSVNVFCYSLHYRNALRNLVSSLVDKCICMQSGGFLSSKSGNVLRVAGKNWKFFFEERGISMQEIPPHLTPEEKNLANSVDIKLTEKRPHFNNTNLLQSRKHYPYEIDAFASEGFLQFFFEDNDDGSFNVYILDEANHLEIYRKCEGGKEQKISEINHIYSTSGNGNNPYKIVQRNFNYPQFYQLLPQEVGVKIVPFYRKNNYNGVASSQSLLYNT